MKAAEDGLVGLVVEAWSEVLPDVQVGPDTNFLAAGGRSLAAMRAGARLAARLGFPVPIQLFFEHTDLADFVTRLEQVAAGRPA